MIRRSSIDQPKTLNVSDEHKRIVLPKETMKIDGKIPKFLSEALNKRLWVSTRIEDSPSDNAYSQWIAKIGYGGFQRCLLRTPKQDPKKTMSIPNMELCTSSGRVKHYAQKFTEEKVKLQNLAKFKGIVWFIF